MSEFAEGPNKEIVNVNSEVGIYSEQGKRKYQEDIAGHLSVGDAELYVLFDGHVGRKAVNTAWEFVKNKSEHFLLPAIKGRKKIAGAFTNLFKSIDWEIQKKRTVSGTTALIALKKDGEIWVANAGDSKAVLISPFGNIYPLNHIHRAGRYESEDGRVKKAGGKIGIGGSGKVYRVADIQGRPGLMVTRALGDSNSFPGVIPTPEVKKIKVRRGDTLVLMVDGVWGSVNEKEVKEIVRGKKRRGETAEDMAKDIVKTALKKGSRDNVTCVVVNFD